jgi:hypothetical protein
MAHKFRQQAYGAPNFQVSHRLAPMALHVEAFLSRSARAR